MVSSVTAPVNIAVWYSLLSVYLHDRYGLSQRFQKAFATSASLENFPYFLLTFCDPFCFHKVILSFQKQKFSVFSCFSYFYENIF